ncbi:MAG: glycoside hydrolase family 127 protein [Prevotella sp.]|nr:glycoside hydrolase family 127 protein [Prevotella sp.]
MKKLTILLLMAAATLTASAAKKQQQASAGYPITPVPFTQVKVAEQSFWGQRLEASRTVTIPLAFSKCESEGRYKNFENAAAHLKDPSKVFKVKGIGYSFDDTDPYKTIEGASYILQTYPDQKLKAYVDSVLDIIAAAQEPDGYLYTARTQNPDEPHHWAGRTRWSKEEDLSHELYNLGHMVEAAVAHWQATGSRKFLDIARRYADCVVREVGPNPGQACVVPGHQIAEMALAKLYLATGEKKYLDEAKFLLDYRGKTTIVHDYSQAHKPVIEQDEAVGHAVRAAYMYAGMADVAALTGDSAYIHAIDAIWDNIVTKKLYITGGIGATASGEAFGPNYYLPNMSAYCETCAAIGNVYVNYRLFLLHGESKYYDVLERTLYNGLISGVSLDGGGFFYPNVLESMGERQRQAWFGCACCPSNICRFIPSLPGYVYAVKEARKQGGKVSSSPAVYVNLFLPNSTTLEVAGKKVTLSQQTNYPWDGDITVAIDKNQTGQFALKLRIPGWAKNQVVPSNLYNFTDNERVQVACSVNGKTIAVSTTPDGYLTIDRKWKKGDVVRLHFDMPVRTVRALELVEADRGMVSVERGPLVYCAEAADNDFDVMNLLMNQNPKFDVIPNSEIKIRRNEESIEIGKQHGDTNDTYQLTKLATDAQTLAFDKQGRLTTENVRLTLIPYYAWCHRERGNMKVWMAQDLRATRPMEPPTLASQSKIGSSMRLPSLNSICDRLVPKDGDDRSIPYTHWWPKENSTEWISYTFPEAATVQSSTVYWYDDQPWQGCKVPDSWKLYYKDEQGEWQPVQNPDQYPVLKGAPCTVNFDPVSTTAVKLEVKLPEHKSAGVFEWSVR